MRSILFAVSLIVGSFTLPLVQGQAKNRDIRACLSISDVNERIECLEGRAQPPQAAPTEPSLDVPQQAPSVSPSFDCRLARSSVERAICSDSELAEWDSRMGRALQLAL